MEIEKALTELGLSDNETRAYLFLLEKSPCSPQEVSSGLGFHRAYGYDVLDRLANKGLATLVFVEGKKCFQALPPETLVEQAKARLDLIREAIPELKRKTGRLRQDIQVEIRKGKSVFRHLLSDVLNAIPKGGELLAINVDERQTLDLGGFYLERYFHLVKRRKISERIIIPKGGVRLEQAKTTQYRQLDPDLLGKATTWIYGNKIVFFSTGERPQAVFLENESTADSYRRLFELLWKKAKTPKAPPYSKNYSQQRK